MNKTTLRSKTMTLIGGLVLASTFALSYAHSAADTERIAPAAISSSVAELASVATPAALSLRGPTNLSRCGALDGRACERDGQMIRCLSSGGTGHCFCTSLTWTCFDAPL